MRLRSNTYLDLPTTSLGKRSGTKRGWKIVAVALLTASMPVLAQDLRDQMKQGYFNVARNYSTMIKPYLTPSEHEIVGDIRFEYSPSYVLNAVSFKEGDARKIVVSFGWMALAYDLLVAYWVSGERQQPKCFEEFIKSVATDVVENGHRKERGTPLKLVPTFGTYVQSGQSACEGITMTDLNNPDVQRLTAISLESALAWVIGHEVAHHVKGHVDSEKQPTLAESRKMEAEADAWSLERAFDIRINPSPAHPVLLFYAMTGMTDHDGEMQSTHPASIRRYANFIDGIIKKARDTGAYRKKFGSAIPKGELEDLCAMKRRAQQWVPD